LPKRPSAFEFEVIGFGSVTTERPSEVNGRLLATPSRQCFKFLNVTSLGLVVLPSKPFSISRTHREQNLQTNCKLNGAKNKRERKRL
jgi:hypothetical protein